jgi:hypothetical protein
LCGISVVDSRKMIDHKIFPGGKDEADKEVSFSLPDFYHIHC